MSANPSLVIAKILASDFARWRGLVTGPPAAADAIVADLERTGYFRIRAERPAAADGSGVAPPDWPGSRPRWLEPEAAAVLLSDGTGADANAAPRSGAARGLRAGRVEILLLADGSPCASSGPELRRTLRMLLAMSDSTPLVEVFVVAEDPFFAKKNMTEVVEDFRHDHPAITWHTHRYCNFATCLPEHEAVPPHRILSAEESAAVLSVYRRGIRDLPEMSVSDPAAIWLGAKEGDVVQIVRDSATAMVSCYWRRVTNRPFP